MKLLHAIIVASIATASAAVAQNAPAPAKDIRQRIDEEFDNARLKSIVLEYESQRISEGRTDSRTVLFVKDHEKIFLRFFLPDFDKYDYLVNPPVETTNGRPVAFYLWDTGKVIVEGASDPKGGWFIYPPGQDQQSAVLYWLEETYQDLNDFLCLSSTPDYNWSRDTNLTGQRPTTNGTVYLFGAPPGFPQEYYRGEYYVSDLDGGGVAPVRSKDQFASGLAAEDTWSGWMNHNGIWVPQTSIQWNISQVGGSGDIPRLVEETTTFKLIRAEQVNEPIHPRWFMPQFPAYHVKIADNTVDPPRIMDNIDLDGDPYPQVKEKVVDDRYWEEEGEAGGSNTPDE